ncbi:hypothetical protein FRC03_009290 [Tulasnella sp. 419]|nr:hypothetical protein FRC03_009290 [Tulasnella sp. 419]
MESCQRLVQTWIATSRDQEIKQLVDGITNDEIKLLDIVKALGDALTSEDGKQRGKGIELLAEVLEGCRDDKISRQSTVVLNTFFRNKLDEADTVISAIRGILRLSSLPNFFQSDAIETFKALAANVNMKSHIQSTRYNVFRIIDNLMARHRGALKQLGDEFLKGYLSLAEGEKDPRNLLLAFSIGRVILIEFDIKKHIDDFFDITFCYFPITFKPPPDDPYGISTDDLKSALRGCLAATPYFGLLAIPLFMEKLSASAGHVKRDTLDTLGICLPIYGTATAKKFASTMWESFKTEIFQPIDSQTEEKALKAAQVLITVLASGDSTSTDDLVLEICAECIRILREPEKNQAQHAIKVLSTCISTTPQVSQLALSQAIPHLLKLLTDPTETTHRAVIITEITSLITATREAFSDSPSGRKYEEEKPLDPYKDQLLGSFISNLSSSNTRRASLEGLLQLVLIPKLLTLEELGYMVHNINNLLESSIEADDIRGPILNVLTATSRFSPKLVEETTLPILFMSLPDRAPPIDAHSQRASYQRTLKSLSTLCHQANLFETFVIRLTTKLEMLFSSTGPHPIPTTNPESMEVDPTAAETQQVECNAAYAHAILATLDNVLNLKVAEKHADVSKYVDRLVPRLYALFFQSATSPTAAMGKDIRLLSVAASIIASIVSTLTNERQEAFASQLFDAYYKGDYRTLTSEYIKDSLAVEFSPFGASSSEEQKNLIVLFSAPLIPLKREVEIPAPDLSRFMTDLLWWSLDSTTNESQRRHAFQLIASVLNKHVEELEQFLAQDLEKLKQDVIVTQSVSIDKRRHSISLWTWISRSLVIRNHPQASSNIDVLFGLFDDQAIGWDAAKAIGEIERSDSVLSKPNHAVIRVLSLQKFSNMTLPRIMDGHKKAKEKHQQLAYLVALTSLIRSMPKIILGERAP